MDTRTFVLLMSCVFMATFARRPPEPKVRAFSEDSTADSERVDEKSYYAFDGCSSNPTEQFVDDAPGFWKESDKAEIVCCSLGKCSRKDTEGACRSGDNNAGDNYKVTWSEANQHCEDAGMKLCSTQEELDNCCYGGCNYDNQLVWSDKTEDSDSDICTTDADCNDYASMDGCVEWKSGNYVCDYLDSCTSHEDCVNKPFRDGCVWNSGNVWKGTSGFYSCDDES